MLFGTAWAAKGAGFLVMVPASSPLSRLLFLTAGAEMTADEVLAESANASAAARALVLIGAVYVGG